MIKRQKWTQQEDDALTQIMASGLFKGKWDVVAADLRKRGFAKTPKQTKTRWINNLAPDVNKNKWSAKDTESLFENYQVHGNKWRKIAQSFEGRTDNCVKNQFFSLIRKALRTAVKLTGKKSELSCTRIINKIKPKILADFLNQEIIAIDGEYKIKTIDFVRVYVCKKMKEASYGVEIENKETIQQCIDLLLRMNSNYLSEKNVRSPGTKVIKSGTIGNRSQERCMGERSENGDVCFSLRDKNLRDVKEFIEITTEDNSQQMITIRESLAQINELLSATSQFNSYAYSSADNLKFSLMGMFDKLGVLANDVKDRLANVNCDEQHLYDIASYLAVNSPPLPQNLVQSRRVEKFQTPSKSVNELIIEKRSNRVFSIKNVGSSVSRDFDAPLNSSRESPINVPQERNREDRILSLSESKLLTNGQNVPVNDAYRTIVGKLETLSSSEDFCFEFSKHREITRGFTRPRTESAVERVELQLAAMKLQNLK